MNKSKLRTFSDDQGHEMCAMCGNVFNRLINKEIGNIQGKPARSTFNRGCGRINLHCTFQEKDQVKSLGAKWDNQNRTWFIVDIEDITPFMRWVRPKGDTPETPRKPRAKIDSMVMGITGSTNVASCDCDVEPWEDCEHTEAAANKSMLEMLGA